LFEDKNLKLSGMSKRELWYKIAATKISLVGPITARNLISYCGSPEAIFEATKKELLKIPGIGEKIADSVLSKEALKDAEAEIEFIERHGIQTHFYLDKKYPARLKHFPDSPLILYYKGNANLDHGKTVGIVGTRQPTPSGIAICDEIVEGLQAFKPLVISGLAYGIDITAHRKCLETGIPTVGVLGHGMSKIYPPQHRSVAEKMMENGGVLTEFSSAVGPDRENFPLRNRIIAGLCDALIVVETARQGGSIITAQIANNYNKDVFAVPGRIKDKYSQGCNELIKTNRAALLESVEDLAYIMRWDSEDAVKPAKQRELFLELSDNERLVVGHLGRGEDAAGIDKLMYETNLTTSEISSILLELEFKGVVRSLPGKRFALA
jgi:DNA processing protein